MSKITNPAEQGENPDKFAPQNVQDEGAGNVTSSGRKDRNMEDVPRGGEIDTSRKGPQR